MSIGMLQKSFHNLDSRAKLTDLVIREHWGEGGVVTLSQETQADGDEKPTW